MPLFQRMLLVKVPHKRSIWKQLAVRQILGHHLPIIKKPDLFFSNNTKTFIVCKPAFETEDRGYRMVIARVMGSKRP